VTPSQPRSFAQRHVRPTPALAWKTAVFATLAVGALAAALTARLPSAQVWSAQTPGDCAEYCEGRTRCGSLASRDAVQQPLNAWSNLAFLFAGALVWRRPLRPSSALFAVSLTTLAAGSFLFHAAVTREFQWLDMVGTYAALVAVAARGFVVVFGAAESVATAAALLVDALFAAFKWHIDALVALPVLIAVIAVPMAMLVRSGRCSVRTALIPFGLVVAATAFRQLDVAGVLCFPESRVFQGHALWHLLCAASLGTAFFAFGSAPAPEVA
jgi:hypothetical protein